MLEATSGVLPIGRRHAELAIFKEEPYTDQVLT